MRHEDSSELIKAKYLVGVLPLGTVEGTMTEDTAKFSEFWLSSQARLTRSLLKDERLSSASALACLIRYESMTRRRKHLIRRLLGRWAKLMREEQMRKITSFFELYDPEYPINQYTTVLPDERV